MKAILEFSLPEEEPEHRYALAGTDALILIEDLCSEIRSKLRYDTGDFKDFRVEEYNEDGKSEMINATGDNKTLERVWNWIIEQKQIRQIPELV
jgi:hypothetical protein